MPPPSLSSLFSPLAVGSFELAHRVVMSTPPRRRARAHGIPTALMALHYGQRTSAGGLLITEPTAVGRDDAADPAEPGLYSSEQANLWRQVTDAVHQRGGIVVAQLAHQGGPATALDALIDAFRDAAENAGDAGFDGVELQAGPQSWLGRLLHTPATAEEGVAALSDLLQALCGVWGAPRVGLSAAALGDQTLMLLPELQRLRLAYLRLTGPAGPDSTALRSEYSGAWLAAAEQPADAAAAVAQARVDAVTFDLAFVANPDLPQRLRTAAPLASTDTTTLDHGGARGYTDYPSLNLAA